MSARQVLVALCTYNEIDTLPELVALIRKVLPDVRILVVDDNSPDGTGDWCDQFAEHDAFLQCIHRQGKLGLGSATIEAMRFAIKAGCDVIVTLDADLSHDPAYLPEMLKLVEQVERCDRFTLLRRRAHRGLASQQTNHQPRAQSHQPSLAGSPGPRRERRVSGLSNRKTKNSSI